MDEKDDRFTRFMKIAREWMAKHEVASSLLAKGDASPFMTDQMTERLAEAEQHLQKYRVAKPR
jgi:hypothetical protein